MDRRARFGLAVIVLLGLLVRLPFAFGDTAVSPDMGTFVSWARTIAEHGLVDFTDKVAVVVYPPLSMLLIGAAGAIATWWGALTLTTDPAVIPLIKLPPIAADLGLALLVAGMLRGRRERLRLGAAALIVFNPALWFLSVVWGQIDSVYLFFCIGAFAAIGRAAVASSVMSFGLAVACKVQPLVLAPVLAVAWLRARRPRQLAIGAAVTLTLLVVLLLPWLVGGGLGAYLGNLWGVTARLDDSATNAWFLLRLGNIDQLANASEVFFGLPASVLGDLLVVAVIALATVAAWSQPERVGLALPATVAAMAPYLLLTGMRERYLLPAVPFSLLLATHWDGARGLRGGWLVFVGITFTETVNLLAFAPPDRSLWSGNSLDQVSGSLARPVELLCLAGAAVSSLTLLWLLVVLLRRWAPWERAQADTAVTAQ